MGSKSGKLRSFAISPFLFPALFAALLLAGSIESTAQTFSTIYTFPGGSGGANPGGLVQGKGGVLYSWTVYGGIPKSCGTVACGTVFQLKPPAKSGGKWTKTTIYTFQGGTDGGWPAGKLLVGSKGELYGVTPVGGNATCNGGCGTVFQLVPPTKVGGAWTKNTIYSFGGPDGANPAAGVIADSLGNLYGTTSVGGNSLSASGVVFQLSPPLVMGTPWTETLIHTFNPNALNHDGYDPRAELLLDKTGTLYGTTANPGGCSFICGTLFAAIPPNTEGPIAFFGGLDGSQPAHIILRNGIVYGVTTKGGSNNSSYCGFPIDCGVIFEWNVTKSTLYSFDGTNGLFPDAIVSDSNGALFVAAGAGGSNPSGCSGNGCGTILKLSKAGGQWTPTKIHDFTGGTDGSVPSSLINSAGVFYGTTSSGGSPTACKGRGCGTVFRIQ